MILAISTVEPHPFLPDYAMSIVRSDDVGLLPCNITVASWGYNLCPLLRPADKALVHDVTIHQDTPPTETRSIYSLRLGAGGLPWDGTLPSELQCPKGTWICLKVVNRRPSHPSEPERIFQVVPIATEIGLDIKNKIREDVDELGPHQRSLGMTLHGGLYAQHTQKAAFQFYCDPEIQEPTSPRFLWEWNGTHTFEWRNKYACPVSQRAQPIHPAPDPDPPSTPPADPDADNKKASQGPGMIFQVVVWAVLLAVLLRFCYKIMRRRGLTSRPPHEPHDLEELPLTPSPRYGKLDKNQHRGGGVYIYGGVHSQD